MWKAAGYSSRVSPTPASLLTTTGRVQPEPLTSRLQPDAMRCQQKVARATASRAVSSPSLRALTQRSIWARRGTCQASSVAHALGSSQPRLRPVRAEQQVREALDAPVAESDRTEQGHRATVLQVDAFHRLHHSLAAHGEEPLGTRGVHASLERGDAIASEH